MTDKKDAPKKDPKPTAKTDKQGLPVVTRTDVGPSKRMG